MSRAARATRRTNGRTVLLSLTLTTALACGGTDSPIAPSQTPRQVDCRSAQCFFTGTVGGARAEKSHVIELVRMGEITLRLGWSDATARLGWYVWLCPSGRSCGTGYDEFPSTFPISVAGLSMAANRLQIGDSIMVSIYNLGESPIPYTLEIEID